MPIQQMLLGTGVATKTYIDDVFSSFLYEGLGSGYNDISVNNGIDLSGEGGLVWVKNRDDSKGHVLADTVRGATKTIYSDTNAAEVTHNNRVKSFSSTGFTLGKDDEVDYQNKSYSSWSFRKAPGFFDVVTYTGNGTAGRQLSHNLGCAPGMVAIKCTSDAHNWSVWHRGLSSNAKTITLNDNAAEFTNDAFNGAAPSSTVIHLSSTNASNANTKTYVAYLWAGGESTAATARSVDFDGTTDALQLASSSDFAYGPSWNDFTIECWVYPDSFSGQKYIFDHGTDDAYLHYYQSKLQFYNSSVGWQGSLANCGTLELKQWSHIAVVRHGGTTKVYVNGVEKGSQTDSKNYSNNTFTIGHYGNIVGSSSWDGKISNVRVVKGTAVYTSAFKPPTEPLTSISGTVLLCCNNSSVTGKTTGGTITAHNNVSASSDSPFDDPAGFIFGDAGDQNVIKCGSYKTASNEDAIVNLGWEPQWVLAKRTDSSTGGDWMLYDSMRGLSNKQDVLAESGVSSALLVPNNANSETNARRIGVDATGFVQDAYGANREYIYCAIRRPDGYVGKPPELGTEVFTMDGTANGSNVFPQFTSGFPVDFSLTRNPTAGGTWDSWHTGARLLQGTYQLTATASAWADGGNFQYDYNDGIFIGGWTNYMSWMWKRHAGMDLVTFKGDGVAGRQIMHNLSKTPEMIWVKQRNATKNWDVYHKGLNGGSSPEDYHLVLNDPDAEANNATRWNDTAPTSTHFTLGSNDGVNGNNDTYLAVLFASVEGISKVGYYAGTTSNLTITTGFQPRFVIIKNITTADSWYVLDTTRGWGSGNDQYLQINSTAAQVAHDFGAPTSTGFTLGFNNGAYNNHGDNFIYYAHA